MGRSQATEPLRDALARKKKFDLKKEVRALARERVGPVPPARPIEPDPRKKPKHKKLAGNSEPDALS